MAEVTASVKFALVSMKTEQYALLESIYDENKKESVRINTGITIKFNKEDQIVVVSPKFTFSQDTSPFIIIEVASFFKIEDESWKTIYNKTDEQLNLSKGLAAHLAAVSIGVIRGVLHTKTEQTPFNSFIIPLVNVKKGFEEDLQIKG
jgi:hypothetical protein